MCNYNPIDSLPLYSWELPKNPMRNSYDFERKSNLVCDWALTMVALFVVKFNTEMLNSERWWLYMLKAVEFILYWMGVAVD